MRRLKFNSDFSNEYQLCTQLKNGNEKAYDFLMDTCYTTLCTYAFTLTKNHDDAEDIVQNTFVKVWITRKKINPNLSIKNYLYKLVYNEFIDQYRKNKPVTYLEKQYLEAIELVVENRQEEIDNLMEILNKAVEKLPPKCKKVFILSKREGLTHTEISEYLNLSIKTVEGHMTSAFKILAEKLKIKIDVLLFLCFQMNLNKPLQS